MQSMKAPLLYLNHSRGWGGLEMFSLNLFKWLSNRDWPIYFSCEKASRLHQALQQTPYADRVFARKTIKYFDPISLPIITTLLKKKTIHLIHTFKSSDIFFSAAAASLAGASKPLLVHHLQMLPKHPRKDPLHRLAYGHLNKLLAITSQIAERAKTLWPINPAIVSTLYYGIDPTLYGKQLHDPAQQKARFGIPSSSRTLGIVGQVCEIKGQLLVLRAFKELSKEFPDLFLVIAGAPAPGSESYQKELEAYAAAHAIQDRVKFCGFVPEIPELMACLDFFVLGSKAEPFGLVVLEAMASGALVVASAAGGVPEIITHAEDGLLYEAQNLNDLINTLKNALTLSAPKRQKIIENAYQTVCSRFSLSVFLERLETIYREMLQHK
ncbi:MAG: glycosyltransferase family 4 protein [Deltaproteobacteria bacterium]|nr:glycosyltransferase family 4 protein [Deltaproteobacteria bacterium]